MSAASRNGVAPISFSRVLFRFAFFVIRAFRLAPLAASFFDELEAGQVAGPFGRRIVVADARLADRSDRVQRPYSPAASGVRVGAGLEQVGGQLEVAVRRPPAAAALAPAGGSGRRSRAGAGSAGIVSFTSAPAFSSDADDVDAAFAHGEQQRA